MTVSNDHDEYAAAATQPKESNMNVKPLLKAFSAAAVADATGIVAAQDGGISGQEWVTIVVGGLLAGFATFYVPYQSTKLAPPNRPAE